MAIGAALQEYIDKEIWASTGTADLVDPDTITGLSIEEGYGAAYSSEGGQFPEREGFNWLFNKFSALLVEFLTRGIPEWHTNIDYVHPAVCLGSDGQIYRTVRSNNGVDPTTDTDRSDWTNASPRGWSALPAVVADGDRRVLQLSSWIGGQGQAPAGAMQYFAASGLVAGIANAVDIRGPRGLPGGGGERGTRGWSPHFNIFADGERRVMRLVGWVGGEGSEPGFVGRYLAGGGFTTSISSATDIRGPKGDKGDKGDRGGIGATYEVAALTADKAIGASSAFIDGVSVAATVGGAAEVRVTVIASDPGNMKVLRGTTEIVASLPVQTGVNQFVFGDAPTEGSYTYKFQVEDMVTLRKGSSIAVVNPN